MLKSGLYNILFLFTAFSFTAGLRITSQLSVFVLMATVMLFIHVTALVFSERKMLAPVKGRSNTWAFLFLFITFYTMLIRGIGFEFLGSSKSGGMFYIQLYTTVLLYTFLIKAKVSDRFVSLLFCSYFLATALPFLADALFLLNGGETILHKIIPGSSTIAFYAENEDGLLRIQSAASFAEYLVVVMLVFFPIFNKTGGFSPSVANISILVFCLVLVGLSGHRIGLIGISLLILIYYRNRFGFRKLVKPLIFGGAAAMALCILAVLRFEQLPASFQRVFSFLPFTPTNATTLDAGDSLNFRVLMAAKAFMMLPDFFLVGKGFAFVNYEVDLTDFFGIIDFFAEIGVFHNGVLGLLINLGVPGLIVGLGLIISLNRATGKPSFLHNINKLENIQLVLKSKILLSTIYFIFLYGDVQSNFMELMMLATLHKFVNFHMAAKAATANIS